MKKSLLTLSFLLIGAYFLHSQSLCGDGEKNGDEVGIDCGGMYCPPCFNNGNPSLQRKFTHYKFADLNGLADIGSNRFEMATDTAGERIIVSTGDKKIFVVKIDGSAPVQIFDYKDWRAGCPCRAPFVDISADGKKVLWTDGEGEIWVANFDGSGKGYVADTIPNASPNFADLDYFSSMPPRFTHQADKIIFSLDHGNNLNIGLYAVSVEGGHPIKFVSTEDIGGDTPILYGGNNFTGLTISAENDILFSSSIKKGFSQTEVYLYDRNENLEFLYPTAPSTNAHNNLKITRDGKYVLINDTRVIPGTVIVLNRNDNTIKTIDPPGFGSHITISTNDDASLILLNNYSLSGTQSDILVNQDGMILYPLHQKEIANKYTNAINMLMPPNGKRIHYIIAGELWTTELNPKEIDSAFPQMLSYTIAPNWVAKTPITTTAIQVSAQEGADELISEVSIVDFNSANQPYDRLSPTGGGFTNILYNDGMSNGDLEVDNIYTSNAIRYRSRFGESFPDTLTLRFHLWGADRITSYDLYPFFVLDAAHTTSTEDRSSLQHFNIRPNISKDRVFIDINTKASMRMAYTIINAQGHKMQRSNTLKVTGQQNLELNIISYPSGTYFLMLEAEGQLFVKPFLKL